jgi:hypothetical protein
MWLFFFLNTYPSLEDRSSAEGAAGNSTCGDFTALYAAGKAALAGEPKRAYEIRYIAETARYISGAELRAPWAYPPTFTMLLAPLGLFSPSSALVLWLAVLTIAAVAAARLVTNWGCAGLAPIYPGCMLSLACEQNGTLTTALLLSSIHTPTEPGFVGSRSA